MEEGQRRSGRSPKANRKIARYLKVAFMLAFIHPMLNELHHSPKSPLPTGGPLSYLIKVCVYTLA